MPVSEISEAVAGVEEVAASGETVGSVDLATVSQQLDTLTVSVHAQLSVQLVMLGLILGVAVAQVIGRLWK